MRYHSFFAQFSLFICLSLSLLISTDCAFAARASEPLNLQIDWPDTWHFSSQGSYFHRIDRRSLAWIAHPWEHASTGDFGALKRMVTIPQTFTPPCTLRFYAADDYAASDWRPKPDDWLGMEQYTGHRFKQVLVDGQVIWESDVADENPPQADGVIHVDLTPYVQPGHPFELILRVFDRHGVDVELDGDLLHIGTTETQAKKPGDPKRFMTHVWWGDVFLEAANTSTVSESVRPLAETVERRHHARRLSSDYGSPMGYEVVLHWDDETEFPSFGYPVRCGISVPPGTIETLEGLRLTGPGQKTVPLQAQVLNHWSDGSVRWILLDFTGYGSKDSAWRLHFSRVGGPSYKPRETVHVDSIENTFTIHNPYYEFEIGGSNTRLIDSLFLTDEHRPALHDLGCLITLANGSTYLGQWDTFNVLEHGPQRASVRLTGKMQSLLNEDSFGRFEAELVAVSSSPALELKYRIYNDSAETIEIETFTLMADVPRYGNTDLRLLPHETLYHLPGRTLSHITQPEVDAFALEIAGQAQTQGKKFEGFVEHRSENGALLWGIKDFWQQFPKRIEFTSFGVSLDMFARPAGGDPYRMVPGEAKTHRILIGVLPMDISSEDANLLAQCFQNPPRLFNADWVCRSGGMGYAATVEELVEPGRTALLDYFRDNYKDGDSIPNEPGYGIRDFGDYYYNKEENTWRNNYYDIMKGLSSAYLMTGGGAWFDRLEEVADHYIDVDVIHSPTAKSGQPGLAHHYGKNHTEPGPWAAMLRLGGLVRAWRLSGNRDYRDAALAMADAIIEHRIGIGSGSVRDHAGVLSSMAYAYDETWDRRYLNYAAELVRDAASHIDLRRGTYPEVHGNMNYRGNVPWMNAQLMEPLYLYYRQSGDLLAAQLLVGQAESIITENMTPDVPGDIYGYSHNPHFEKTSGYHILIAPALFYAYELTGDPGILQCAVGAWNQAVQEKTFNSVLNCFWNAPTLLYYLQNTEKDWGIQGGNSDWEPGRANEGQAP